MQTVLSLMFAIMIVESNCDPKAIGDQGRSFGILQIQEAVVLDVNNRYGTDYTHEDMFDPLYAQDVFMKYIEMYCTDERLGHKATFKDMAQCWNSGPHFMKKQGKVKERLEIYWRKVQREL